MKTYTGGRNIAGIWTKNTNAVNLTYLDEVANDDYRRICALKDWPFLERLRLITTTAATQFTALPYDCDQVREINVIPIGSTIRYTPQESPSREHWDNINASNLTKSDIPEWYYVTAGKIGLYPIPSSTGNSIYVTQKTRPIDLSIADITTTTVTSITNGQSAVVVSGGLTPLMAGMWIRITYAPGTVNTGDGVWYEIAGVSGTTITLVRAYGGTTIAAGTAACTIAQVPLLPEAFQDLPWLWAAGTYWQKEDDNRAAGYFSAHGSTTPVPTGRVKELVNAWSSTTTGMVVDSGDDYDIIDPNLLITL